MEDITLVRRLNLVMTGFGVAVFVLLLGFVNLTPDRFEDSIKNIVIAQTSVQVSEALSEAGVSLETGEASVLTRSVTQSIQSRIDEVQHGLDAGLDQMVADVLASACKLDCDRREQAAAAVRNYMEGSIARLENAKGNLEQLILGKYETVTRNLRADLNIFAGSNLALLSLSFLLSWLRRSAARHLLPIAVILTFSTALMSIWYLFGQNWVMTIVFSEYWGWGYPLMQGFIAALLLDVALNAGRATTRLLNWLLNAAGSATQLVPC